VALRRTPSLSRLRPLQLQAVLASVDGLLARGCGHGAGRRQLAALGTAAAWRLGQWPLLSDYLQARAASQSALPHGATAALTPGRCSAAPRHERACLLAAERKKSLKAAERKKSLKAAERRR
jgi:hypothetical protein